MFLLDTVTISAVTKRRPDPSVLGWMRAQPSASLYISVVTIGEIQRGIERVRRLEPGFAADLTRWLEETIIRDYGDRVLPFTVEIARRWGELSHIVGNANADVMIAATAAEHGLTVATRNVRHFGVTGVPVVDPFQTRPAGAAKSAPRRKPGRT